VCVARGRRIVQRLFLLKFDPRDDDDEFLYGDSELKESSLSNVPAAALVVDLVPSAGETHLFWSCAPRTRFVFYSSQRNIIDILLTCILACASVEPDE